MERPPVHVDLRPYFQGEQRDLHAKNLVVLHETVSHNQPGTGDIHGVAAYMDAHGLEIHLIIDKEGNTGWCYQPKAVYDHAASGDGGVNTRSVGIELVSEIPLLPTNLERRRAWLAPDREKQLDTAAAWVAFLSTIQPIPLRFSGGRRSGITTHWNVSDTYLGGQGHWDCKPIHKPVYGHFPAMYIVYKARQIRGLDEA